MADELPSTALNATIMGPAGHASLAGTVRRPCLSICFRCTLEGWEGADDRRPGADLADAIETEALRQGILGRIPPLIAGVRQVRPRPVLRIPF